MSSNNQKTYRLLVDISDEELAEMLLATHNGRGAFITHVNGRDEAGQQHPLVATRDGDTLIIFDGVAQASVEAHPDQFKFINQP